MGLQTQRLNSQPFPKQAHICTCLQHRSFKNYVEKGEIAQNEQFLFFLQCFLLFLGTLSFSSNSKLSPANSSSFGESKI